MVALAAGSVDSGSDDTSDTSPSDNDVSSNTDSSNSDNSVNSTNSEIDKLFAARQKQYETQHKAWEAAKDASIDAKRELAQIEKEIASLAKEKPVPPKFESREWATVVGDYKTEAILIDTDNVNVNLRKVDGATVTVAKDKLNGESRIYVEEAFTNLSNYKDKVLEWTKKCSALDKKRNAEEQKIADANKPEPQPPSRELVAEEVAANNAKKRKEQMAAKAEAERKAAAAAAAKAEEELDVNGLVLMRKTLSGTTSEFGGTITGIVENRRSRKLSYAQITFNLYDESGAQVGSAMANINGLEPGGRWKFEASSFGTRFSKYKFSELTGF